ncbi:MAG: histidine phosphatase family protein [Rickettsiales bacterium]|nr:MAG: histidine phosphatase family protein [Rickettsiales bacterium]
MKKLYLFRHGETDWNKEHRIQCQTDIPLNETGIQQAEKNAELLKDKGIQVIYSSHLDRAFKTGEILAKKINVDIIKDEGLAELNGGEWSGKKKEEIIELFGKASDGRANYDIFSHTRNDGMNLGYVGGETKQQTRDRFVNAVLNICKTSKYDIIGIASHGFVIREFIRMTDFEDDSGIENCEYVEAEYDNGEIKIIGRAK